MPLDATYASNYATTAADDDETALTPKIMNMTEADARVTWSDLAGGDEYCFGIAQTPQDPGDATAQADDAPGSENGTEAFGALGGTFLRAAEGGGTPTAPQFVAVVNRQAN
jgi:hypothetical protein